MKEKVLIVEDNPQNMRLLEMTLRDSGYALLKATNGEEALDMAVRERPGLVLLDMGLPKMDGLEVARRLRQMPAFSHISIIAVTAHAMKGDEEKFIEAGCDAYLSKPISTRELPRVVAEMLQHQRVNT